MPIEHTVTAVRTRRTLESLLSARSRRHLGSTQWPIMPGNDARGDQDGHRNSARQQAQKRPFEPLAKRPPAPNTHHPILRGALRYHTVTVRMSLTSYVRLRRVCAVLSAAPE
jgi:hypothetical protein